MSKCLKKRELATRSGAGASRLPVCRLYEQLQFLRDTLVNRPTASNVSVELNSRSNTNDSVSLLSPPPSPSMQSTPSSAQKENLRSSSRAKARKRPAPSESFNFENAIVEAINKEDESADALFCKSLIPTLEALPARENKLAKMDIQKILFTYEFGED